MHGRGQFSFSEESFLAAQTGWDSFPDYDTRLQSSAAACTSLVDESRIGGFDPTIDRQIRELCDLLKKVFTSQNKYVRFLEYRGEAAQDLLDILQKLLDYAPLGPQFRPLLYVALVRLCLRSELCPRSFNLGGVTNREKDSLMAGSFGDVYIARYNGSPVCVKSVKVYVGQGNKKESIVEKKKFAYKAFSREAVVWSQLSHANVLPFYGICFLKDKLYLVSPLVPNGDVNDYLTERPEANRSNLIYGVAIGMEYLHKNGVAHGDLKCANVLVAEPEQALLADFGFSYVTDNTGLNNLALSSGHVMGGTHEFTAPERIADNTRRRDSASDVFAFGMLCLEMFTLDSSDIKRAHDNIIHHSKLPAQPGHYSLCGLTNDLWEVMKKCWSPRPYDRPTATQIKQQLPPSSQENHFGRKTRPDFQSTDAVVTKALNHLRAL
ncbi:hypothetical protein C0992_004740 [Termitomyces sp. T32_za158]|nr:hypothetical protein C0992_004740 [Termitomyces sp. T32_za158]